MTRPLSVALAGLGTVGEAQENFSRGVVALPTSTKAEIDARISARIPKPEQLHLVDWEKIVPQMTGLTEKWNQSIGF